MAYRRRDVSFLTFRFFAPTTNTAMRRMRLAARCMRQVKPGRCERPAALYQPGGMVASMPIEMVSARNPNRNNVILPKKVTSRCEGRWRELPCPFGRTSLFGLARSGTIVGGAAVSIQRQILKKNTDQMRLVTIGSGVKGAMPSRLHIAQLCLPANNTGYLQT